MRRLWNTIIIILGIALALTANASSVPYRELRYEGVIGQTDWYTCGPAAVATLLTHYYGISTTEAEALELAEGFMREMGLEPGPGRGINALALKKTLETKGIPTKGFRVKPEALRHYFARGGLPVILHLIKPPKALRGRHRDGGRPDRARRSLLGPEHHPFFRLG